MLDNLHTVEQVFDAVKVIVPDRVERNRRFEEIKSGRAAKTVRELEPFNSRCEKLALCCRYFRSNLERMR